MIKVIVDAYGGDRGPSVNVDAAIKAIKEFNDLTVILSGKKEELEALLKNYEYDTSRIEIIDAPDVIDCNEVPTVAIKQKTESSMAKAFERLKNDEEVCGMVTTGSTGAMLAGSVLKVGRIRGVRRPASCPLMPTMNGGVVAVCDSGANVDCDPEYLQQFAVMGNLYLQKAYDLEKPRVALLNIGTEEEKGDALRKATYQLLKETEGINFVGNMESRDLLSGDYDLVVADGFSGNVLLKTTEGTALEMLGLVKKTLMTNLKTKIGALFIKKELMGVKKFMDYNNYPGAIILGVSKILIKSHGSSKAEAIYQSIKLAYKLENQKFIDALKESFTR